MRQVQTVTGKTGKLGFCQMHEHLCVEEGPGTHQFPALLISQPENSILELQDFKQAGGDTLLDAQPVGAGRNARILRNISLASGVQIVAVTGYHMPFFYPADHWIHTDDEAALTKRFINELLLGCEEAPDIKPGAVKSALGTEGCEGRTEIKFRAAVNAAATANVPLVIHTELGAGALKAIHIAREAGIPSQRILICHMDRQAEDYRPHEAVADTGVMLEYDTIGRFKYHDDVQEIALIRHMLHRGHVRQLLLSLDTTNRRLARYGGEIGLTYLLCDFIPSLLRAGVGEDEVRQITHENPQKVFS